MNTSADHTYTEGLAAPISRIRKELVDIERALGTGGYETVAHLKNEVSMYGQR